MVRKYLSDDELRGILENSDSDCAYEVSDEDESDVEDNVEEQTEIADECDVEIETNLEPETFYSSKSAISCDKKTCPQFCKFMYWSQKRKINTFQINWNYDLHIVF